MASTLLVRNVLWQCSMLLQDATPQFTRWTEEELVGWLNEARRVLCKYMPMASARTDAIKLQAGTRQSIESIQSASIKPGDGSTPSDVMGEQLLKLVRNMGDDGLKPGRVISITDGKSLDAVDPFWHQKVGPWVRNYVYDPLTPRYFYAYPGVAASASVWVEASIVEQLPEIPYPGSPGYAHASASTVTCGIADRWVDDLINYVCARAHLKDSKFADANQASMFTNLFVASINAQVTAATGVNPNLKRLPFLGDPIGRGA